MVHDGKEIDEFLSPFKGSKSSARSNNGSPEKVLIFSQFLEHIHVIEHQVKSLATFQYEEDCMALLMDGSATLDKGKNMRQMDGSIVEQLKRELDSHADIPSKNDQQAHHRSIIGSETLDAKLFLEIIRLKNKNFGPAPEPERDGTPQELPSSGTYKFPHF
ncbi:hypothetical protein L6452_16469 [Arctium lappa]|uniref:Uncharacterized protein n=1 Tax=Arctium lappa TaxID=4217 RepID=A0ACB9C0M3_ARCLA|nr:hypothetical protein L6452_16469 [Arctium lappa]